MSKTLYLSPPSIDGFDGGAGARYQARREVTSNWYPTWLAQPAALTPNSKLLDCPPHDIDLAKCLAIAKDYDHVIINTSTPSLKNDCKVAEAIKTQKPETKIGFVGAHTMVLPTETLKASPAIDWVGRKEFDFTCKELQITRRADGSGCIASARVGCCQSFKKPEKSFSGFLSSGSISFSSSVIAVAKKEPIGKFNIVSPTSPNQNRSSAWTMDAARVLPKPIRL